MRVWIALSLGLALLGAGCLEGLAPPAVPGAGFECRDGTIASSPELCAAWGGLSGNYASTPEPPAGQPFNSGFKFELRTQSEFHIPDCYTPFTERLPGIGVFVSTIRLPADAVVAVSADLGRFAGYSQALLETREFGARTGYFSRVFIRAPQCTRGADYVIITARVCGTGEGGRYACVRLAKRTLVYVHSCKLCERYTEWVPAPLCTSEGCFTPPVPRDERAQCAREGEQLRCVRVLDKHYSCLDCELPPFIAPRG